MCLFQVCELNDFTKNFDIPSGRKIIYTSEVKFLLKDFGNFPMEIGETNEIEFLHSIP